MRETPWGYITYMSYRERVEFGEAEYHEIDKLCKELGIDWFVSVVGRSPRWISSKPSIRSAINCLPLPMTDHNLLRKVRATGRPMIVSTGMSTADQITDAVAAIGTDNLAITHSTSTYPCDPQELNLKMIQTLKDQFPLPDRLLRPRGWFDHLRGGGFHGRLHRGASLHARPLHVGQRPGRFG